MAAANGLMAGKRGLIVGVANNRSIAWGIAKACADQGAEIALTYQGDAFKKRVEPLAAELGALVAGHCDVTDIASLDAVFAFVEKSWGRLDFLVHAVAFSDKDELDRPLCRDDARQFPAHHGHLGLFADRDGQARRAADEGRRLDPDADLLRRRKGDAALQRHGRRQGGARGQRALSRGRSRRQQGIRVNAISAGPIKTLAASGIGDFRYILQWNEYNSPLKRTVTPEEVGDSGLYFLSDMSRGVTGEIHHVDSGYHVVGMKAVDAPDISTVKD